MPYLQLAATWLAAIHPSLPWLLLTVAIWLAQYLTRKTKLGAIVWEWAANLPFPEDITPTLHKIRKLWQALPGALAGALIGAVGMGGDYAGAALGALAGFAASLKHEALKLSKKISYTGATAPLQPKEKPQPPSDDEPPKGGAGTGVPVALAVLLAISVALGGTTACGLVGGPGPNAATAPSRGDSALELAFTSSVLALNILDMAEEDYLDALSSPSDEQLRDAEERIMRLKRARALLEIAQDWLEDDAPEDEGRRALADAAQLLTIAVDELEAQGVKVPRQVRQGLAAAAALLGVAA